MEQAVIRVGSVHCLLGVQRINDRAYGHNPQYYDMFNSQYSILIIAASVAAIIHIISSASEVIPVALTAAWLLVTEVIGDGEANGTAMPTVLAELPDAVAPRGVTTCAAVQEVPYVERER